MTRSPEAVEDGPAAEIAAAVLAVDDVVALTSGPAGQFRTYLPGGRSVAGVRLDDTSVELDVVARYGPSLLELGDRVAAALIPLAGGRAVTVRVADIVLPGEEPPLDPADSGGGGADPGAVDPRDDVAGPNERPT